MLTLKNVIKTYSSGDKPVEALKGIDLCFRKNEFVSILGPSGCGKTTMLNIIGGLDRYSDGQMVIDGTPTDKFSDNDWDTYRNHSIGFVFQSYNLIPHQTVLENVELALTLSGVNKKERRDRAVKVLGDVGLADQVNKKPNQLSGGQMQRVAIARALINDPEILLADEPTGALDSTTSVQVMEILKKISTDKLIIMVTHNPELADKYSSRIIKLLDGRVTDDSDPYEDDSAEKHAERKKSNAMTSMSFFTALSLSLKNLLTKKGRTFMTAFAGSIGIIGIALILSISNGINAYIDSVQEETLSSYPLAIQQTTVDMSSALASAMEEKAENNEHELDKIYSNDVMNKMMSTMSGEIKTNDLKSLKSYIESGKSDIKDYVTDIQYSYSTPLNIYKSGTEAPVRVNPNHLFDAMMPAASNNSVMSSYSSMDVWKELIGNDSFLSKQYDVVCGKMPSEYNEVVLIVDKNNEITDMTLYSLGLKDQNELKTMMQNMSQGKEPPESKQATFTYDELTSLTFDLLPGTAYFEKTGNVWTDRTEDESYIQSQLATAEKLNVVGIIRPSENSTVNSESGTIGYTHALTEHLINIINDSEIVKAQLADPETDVFSGIKFAATEMTVESYIASLPEQQQAQYNAAIAQMKASGMSDSQIKEQILANSTVKTTQNTYDGNLQKLGVADLESPSVINIYSKDFAAKEKVKDIIKEYNSGLSDDSKIQYTDYVGMLMSSITTIVNVIGYILIAFVAISLIVSSIMIGIITYISVLERTKEIGILRSIGASKKDIARVFNAETIIVGFVAGLIGIGITILLNFPINALIHQLTDVNATAVLPPLGGIILIAISVFLTFIAGLIPASVASKKDPVIALRSE